MKLRSLLLTFLIGIFFSQPAVAGTTVYFTNPYQPCFASGLLAIPVEVEMMAQATSGFLDAAEESINQKFEEGFRALVSGQKQYASTFEQLLVEYMDTQDHLLREQIKAEEDFDREETFGPLAQPLGAELAPVMADSAFSGWESSQDVTKMVSSYSSDRQGSYKTRSQADGVLYDQMDLTSISPEKMFPVDGTITEDDMVASLALEALKLDPSPTLALPQGASPQAAAAYNKAAFLKNAYLAAPLNVVAEQVAYKSPSIETANWQEMTQIALGKTLPEKISPKEFLDLQIDSRINSATWNEKITNTYPAGLLRERLLLKSFQLELARRQDALLFSIVTMLEQKNARDTTKELSPKLNAARNRALSKE